MLNEFIKVFVARKIARMIVALSVCVCVFLKIAHCKLFADKICTQRMPFNTGLTNFFFLSPAFTTHSLFQIFQLYLFDTVCCGVKMTVNAIFQLCYNILIVVDADANAIKLLKACAATFSFFSLLLCVNRHLKPPENVSNIARRIESKFSSEIEISFHLICEMVLFCSYSLWII